VLLLDDGGEREVEASSLRAGQRIRIRPGQAVPADGVVVGGGLLGLECAKALRDKRDTLNLSPHALMQLPRRSLVLLRRAMRLKHE
jgi:NAD(P)H-nitrite reductase large subunit